VHVHDQVHAPDREDPRPVDRWSIAAWGTWPWFFEQLLDDLPASRDWQVGIRRKGIVTRSSSGWLSPTPERAVTEAVKARVRERIPDSWRNFDLGLFSSDSSSRPGAPTGRKLAPCGRD
jgi:hypothetical protein